MHMMMRMGLYTQNFANAAGDQQSQYPPHKNTRQCRPDRRTTQFGRYQPNTSNPIMVVLKSMIISPCWGARMAINTGNKAPQQKDNAEAKAA